jgi:hypothetical protein
MKEGNHCKSFAAQESAVDEQPLILNVLNSFNKYENLKCEIEKTQSDSNKSHDSLMP